MGLCPGVYVRQSWNLAFRIQNPLFCNIKRHRALCSNSTGGSDVGALCPGGLCPPVAAVASHSLSSDDGRNVLTAVHRQLTASDVSASQCLVPVIVKLFIIYNSTKHGFDVALQLLFCRRFHVVVGNRILRRAQRLRRYATLQR